MKIFFKIFILFFLVYIFSYSDINKSDLIQKLNKIFSKKVFKNTSYGISVVNLETQKKLYEKNAYKNFRPASILKLITTYSAYNYLSDTFKIKTEFGLDKNNNLYVKGFGDAFFKTKDLEIIVNEIAKKNIKSIQNIIGDISYFDNKHWGNGWMWDDEPNPSAMYISPLSINFNTLEVCVNTNELNRQPKVILNPNTSYFTIENKAQVKNKIKEKFSVNRKWIERENVIEINGDFLYSTIADTFRVNVWKPEFYFLTLLKEKLLENKISVNGEIQLGEFPKNIYSQFILTPIDSLIFTANKFSNNLCAENLLKIIAGERIGLPATADNGILLEKNFLASIGIDTSEIVIADGSGVSDYNLMSPNNFTTFLKKIYNGKNWEKFFSSLSIGGIDGTLKNRFKGTNVEGKVFAKTGTKRGIASLVGIVEKKNRGKIAFAIIINNYYGETKVLKNMIDEIVSTIYQN